MKWIDKRNSKLNILKIPNSRICPLRKYGRCGLKVSCLYALRENPTAIYRWKAETAGGLEMMGDISRKPAMPLELQRCAYFSFAWSRSLKFIIKNLRYREEKN
jgi:hypothetical protein